MPLTRFQNLLIAALISSIFVTGVHAISSVNPTPGQSDWTVTSNIGVVLDEVTPYQPTELSDSFSGGSTVTISTPGIYRLSAPMTKKIVISTSDVELDLNEYGVSLSGAGIAISVGPGVSNVIVRNGYVLGSGGATTGIFADGTSGITSKIFIRNIRASGFTNGFLLRGTGGALELCEVTSCIADSNTSTGFSLSSCDSSVFSLCNAKTNSFGFVCTSSDNNIFDNCVAILNTSSGFDLSTGTSENLVTNCTAIVNSVGFSIALGTNNLIQSSLALSNSTNFSAPGSNHLYQNRDITVGGVFSWVNNVAASP